MNKIEIEKILDNRKNERNNDLFLVKFRNLDEKYNQWIYEWDTPKRSGRGVPEGKVERKSVGKERKRVRKLVFTSTHQYTINKNNINKNQINLVEM